MKEQKKLFQEVGDIYDRGAIFSPCGRYRYRLWRYWDKNSPPLVMIMLNPSTADVENNDPTIERCQRRAKQWGLGGLEVVNLFAYRATNPKDMKLQQDPVGPDNDKTILKVCLDAINWGGYGESRRGVVVCAWGQHGSFHNRSGVVLKVLRDNKVPLECLALGKDNQPSHPLYISYDVNYFSYWVDGGLDCSRCFHKACCICFEVTARGKEKEKHKLDHQNGGGSLQRTGAGQCVYFSTETGGCTIYNDRPQECRNWSCTLDPRWPTVIEAYLSGKDRYTRKTLTTTNQDYKLSEIE